MRQSLLGRIKNGILVDELWIRRDDGLYILKKNLELKFIVSANAGDESAESSANINFLTPL